MREVREVKETPAYNRQVEDSDSKARLAMPKGVRLRAAYYSIIGPSPTLEPGDRERAEAYYHKILVAIDRGGWTRSECSALHRLKRKWDSRARGNDLHFELKGTEGGRIPNPAKAKCGELRAISEVRRSRARLRRIMGGLDPTLPDEVGGGVGGGRESIPE